MAIDPGAPGGDYGIVVFFEISTDGKIFSMQRPPQRQPCPRLVMRREEVPQ